MSGTSRSVPLASAKSALSLVLPVAVASTLVAAALSATPARTPAGDRTARSSPGAAAQNVLPHGVASSAGGAAKVIVLAAGPRGAAMARVAAVGGRVTRDLPMIGGFGAVVPAAAAPALRADPAVRSVTPDATVRVNAAPALFAPKPPPPPEPTAVYTKSLGADRAWQAGAKGEGVTVAVLDTGVSPHADLAGRLVDVRNDITGQVTPCMNLSGEPNCNDNYGHGTFVAGVVAGDGTTGGSDEYSGVAPEAKVLAIKVTGRSGATDVSNVLAAIQWVVSFKSTYDIKVLNLSMSTDSVQSYRTDPFNYAVERAWDAGIVVVVSASNRGPATTSISKPGDDPLVVTVGATDDRGTFGVGNDEIPDFTARGPTPADGIAKPDVVAPGAHMRSLMSNGSFIAQNSGAPAGPYLRGSGTSFSAAAVSGVAALMLGRNPGMTPNQVKYALLRTARGLPASSDPMTVGAGEVDAGEATLNPPAGSANAGVTRSGATGSLQGARGHVEVQTLASPATVINGVLTAQNVAWDPTGFLLGWNPLSWYVSVWAVTPFLAVTWSADDWPGRNWGGRNWGGGDWEGSKYGTTSYPRKYGKPIDGSIWYGAWG
jgi:serine protease AprX